jgi:hypothetical protein
MKPLFKPPHLTKKSGSFEVLPLMYLCILLSLNLPRENRAMPIKSEALATYSPWKLPAETNESY